MQRQVALIKQSLFDQGYLDEQFIELEELQDDANPNFVEEVATLYFKDSARLISNIEQALERGSFDFNRLDNYMHQFKGSSTSIGASKVKTECTMFREYCRVGNAEGFLTIPYLRRVQMFEDFQATEERARNVEKEA
uniref:Histidine-containing phosphotransfer protein n=1 Tax=Brassica campestris TaxID=3711 RepID=M4CBP9_BRACM